MASAVSVNNQLCNLTHTVLHDCSEIIMEYRQRGPQSKLRETVRMQMAQAKGKIPERQNQPQGCTTWGKETVSRLKATVWKAREPSLGYKTRLWILTNWLLARVKGSADQRLPGHYRWATDKRTMNPCKLQVLPLFWTLETKVWSIRGWKLHPVLCPSVLTPFSRKWRLKLQPTFRVMR